MPRSHTRRRVLLAVGAAGTATTTGCLDWLTRSASDSHGLSVSEAESAHTASEFDAYVGRIHERYGPHGIWGIQNGNEDPGSSERLALVGAWSDQWVLGSPAEDEGIHVPIDIAAVLYRVETSGDRTEKRETHRLWLWTGAVPTQSDSGAGNTTLTTLSVGVDLDNGVLDSYSPTTSIGPDDTPIRIGLDDPKPPHARRRLPAGRIQPNPDETVEGENGAYVLDWTGGHGTAVSVAGVCQLHRRADRDYELTVTSDASASQGTL